MIKTLTFLLLISFNIASFSADYRNGVTHLSQQETIEKIKADQDNVVLIDVRTPREYKNGHLKNAINIPHKNILNNLNLLDQYKDKDIILYCHSGVRVKKVTDVATQNKNKHQLFHLKGDYRAWRARGLEVIKE